MERVSIKPLIECQWGQGSPYNGKLKVGSKTMLAGCTALAIAQICYYWMVQKGYHRGSKATAKYTTPTNKYAMSALPALMVFDWKNLVPKPTTTAQKNAVATLCEYIAKALKSDFGKSATSASRTAVENVLTYHLRMGAPKHIYKSTTADFEQQIYHNIASGKPVFLSATSSGGHSFVLDGYDAATKKYHVNWGWSGKFDDYYALNGLKVDGLNYTGSLMAVVNIEPAYILGDVNGDGKINISDVVAAVDAANKDKVTKQNDINLDGKVTVEDAEIIVEHLIKGDVL